ncbi:MAG: hypothetical protein AVDCRST_MAG33-2692, partial [uncultured Thermomicrobiales bacterium]
AIRTGVGNGPSTPRHGRGTDRVARAAGRPRYRLAGGAGAARAGRHAGGPRRPGCARVAGRPVHAGDHRQRAVARRLGTARRRAGRWRRPRGRAHRVVPDLYRPAVDGPTV